MNKVVIMNALRQEICFFQKIYTFPLFFKEIKGLITMAPSDYQLIIASPDNL